ncbi:unnamed protein product [Protopolystoma xenopodis]|uniref:ABC transmembrane type-1 domain-containing protein n=1 Tax=Protopolystoma xenopodis TaxID=117903 RepID=A0A3S5B440_9PLAT|nr:unnamed protein product [Protopolystoma xenopodis]
MALTVHGLRLSNFARRLSTTGEITNLMSSDAAKLNDLMPYFNIVWSGPFQIIIALVMLWNELGPAVLAGLVVLLMFIPLNAFIAKKSKSFQAIHSLAVWLSLAHLFLSYYQIVYLQFLNLLGPI